jgi:hypothetical protein
LLETEIEKYLRVGKQPPRKTGQRNTKPQGRDSSKDDFVDARHPQQTKIVVPSDDESEESPARIKEKAKSVTSESSQDELDRSMS